MLEKLTLPHASESKICNDCRIDRPLMEFTVHKETKDRLSNYCRACQKKRRRLSYERNRARLAERLLTGTKQCRQCGQAKSVGDFHRNYANLEGLHNLCKTCRRASDRRRFEENERSLSNNPPTGNKVCAKCQRKTKLVNYYVDRTKKDGRKTYCKQCSNEQKKIWLRDNPGKLRRQREQFKSRRKQQSIADLLLMYADTKIK
jgi:hypothetical protein